MDYKEAQERVREHMNALEYTFQVIDHQIMTFVNDILLTPKDIKDEGHLTKLICDNEFTQELQDSMIKSASADSPYGVFCSKYLQFMEEPTSASAFAFYYSLKFIEESSDDNLKHHRGSAFSKVQYLYDMFENLFRLRPHLRGVVYCINCCDLWKYRQDTLERLEKYYEDLKENRYAYL